MAFLVSFLGSSFGDDTVTASCHIVLLQCRGFAEAFHNFKAIVAIQFHIAFFVGFQGNGQPVFRGMEKYLAEQPGTDRLSLFFLPYRRIFDVHERPRDLSSQPGRCKIAAVAVEMVKSSQGRILPQQQPENGAIAPSGRPFEARVFLLIAAQDDDAVASGAIAVDFAVGEGKLEVNLKELGQNTLPDLGAGDQVFKKRIRHKTFSHHVLDAAEVFPLYGVKLHLFHVFTHLVFF